MPTRDEKVAQIETALRRRFFPHVPKIVTEARKDWNNEKHNLNRLSRSLAAYALVMHCHIDDLTAVSGIVDGSNDGGIDAVRFDQGTNRLVLVQSKYKRNGTAPAQDESLKTINGLRKLLNRRFQDFNEAMQAKLDEIERALDTPGVQVDLLIVYLGDAFNTHAKGDLDSFCSECNKSRDVVQWHEEGLEQLYSWLISEQTPQFIDDTIVLEHWSGVTQPYKAFYGQIKAAELARLVERHSSALFERNIRHYLGSSGVNSAIEETVRSKPHELFYLNNGITMIAKTITPAPGQPERCVFGLKNLSIVNGAQTAGSISSATLRGELSPNAKILITIIEIGEDGDALGRQITRARNNQNAVRGIEFAALDPTQERLRRELAAMGITYFYRPSAEARIRHDDAFTLEEAAVAVACLGFKVESTIQAARRRPHQPNALSYIVAAKAEISRLWAQEDEIYKHVFTRTLSGTRMYRLVQCYRFIDPILAATENSEHTYERRMFFRHARYFIMAFVALRSEAIIAVPQLTLVDEEKNELSRCVNEISELIYSAAQPLEGIKGYRAIFRNLTDSQQLADNVLVRLVELDAQQANG